MNGHAGRGSGILRNELYARLLIWNRVWMINDPDTARRVLRPHPEGEGHVGDVPELAIVARELFEAASAGRVSMRACSRPSEAAKAYALWTLAAGAVLTACRPKSGRIGIRGCRRN
ncbi:MAG TPA: hypothetical protein VIU14_18230 [Mesorhizobium sp.]